MSVDEALKNSAGTFENSKASMSPKTATATGPGATVEESLESRLRSLEEENQALRDSEATLKQQNADSQRRERLLVRRIASKEQEMQDYMLQISEYKAAQAPTPAALRSTLLDPAVNLLFQKLRHELQATKAKLEETQNELSAWKFTPDSNTGKRLMAKCRLLYQENEELGKMTSNGRLAKLEASLASHKTLYEEVKKSQSELDDFLQEIDEDVEGMQSTILFLQQELKSVREQNEQLRRENEGLTTTTNNKQQQTQQHCSTTNGSSNDEPAALSNGGSLNCENLSEKRTQCVTNGDELGETEKMKKDANGGVECETAGDTACLEGGGIGGIKRALENTEPCETINTKRTRRGAAAAALDAVVGTKKQQLQQQQVESANGVV